MVTTYVFDGVRAVVANVKVGLNVVLTEGNVKLV
jgi:hypothetical protein